MAELALYDAVSELKDMYKIDITSLRWGDAHIAMHDHLTLGHIPVLNLLINLRQSVSGGDFTLQRGLSSGDPHNPFENVHAAVYRGVYDFSDPDSSLYVISTGQSGHLFQDITTILDNCGVVVSILQCLLIQTGQGCINWYYKNYSGIKITIDRTASFVFRST